MNYRVLSGLCVRQMFTCFTINDEFQSPWILQEYLRVVISLYLINYIIVYFKFSDNQMENISYFSLFDS